MEVPQEDGQGGGHIHLGKGLPRAVSAPIAERQKALGLVAIARLGHLSNNRALSGGQGNCKSRAV